MDDLLTDVQTTAYTETKLKTKKYKYRIVSLIKMPVEIISGEVVQSKKLPDGELQIRKHTSDLINRGKVLYTMFHIGEPASAQFSGRYFEHLTLEQYQNYFSKIESREDLMRLRKEYELEYQHCREID